MARKTKLTKALIATISATIQAGAFDYVACEAAGIHQASFYQWLIDAEQPDANPLKVEFSESIATARAAARLDAEHRVFTEKPDVWLLRGPGRERPGRPGWATENTVHVNAGDTVIQLTWAKASDENATNPD
jgi:hypothetical protein